MLQCKQVILQRSETLLSALALIQNQQGSVVTDTSQCAQSGFSCPPHLAHVRTKSVTCGVKRLVLIYPEMLTRGMTIVT